MFALESWTQDSSSAKTNVFPKQPSTHITINILMTLAKNNISQFPIDFQTIFWDVRDNSGTCCAFGKQIDLLKMSRTHSCQTCGFTGEFT